MKKLIFTIALIAACGTAMAQAEEGSWLVGGSSSLGFNSITDDQGSGGETKTTNINLNTKSGYFVMENLAIGIVLDFLTSKDEVTFPGSGSFTDKTTITTIGPFVRYYVNGKVFIGAAYGASSTKFVPDSGPETKVSGGTLMFEAGYPIWITNGVALEPALNYNMGMGDFDTFSSFGLGLGIMAYF